MRNGVILTYEKTTVWEEVFIPHRGLLEFFIGF